MIDGTEEMRKTLERFNLNSGEDKEKIDFIYNNVIKFGERQYKNMDIHREKARLFFPATITLIVFLASGILVSYDIALRKFSWSNSISDYVNLLSYTLILCSLIFLLLSSRNFNQVLKNVRLQSETPPVELGEIYNENIYTIKSTIIITLLKAIIERKKQLDRLAH